MKKILMTFLLLLVFASSAVADIKLDMELLNAVTVGDIGKVESLLKQGASPNSAQSSNGFNVLMAATRFEDGIILQTLVDAGANVNACMATGESPLLYAVMSSNIKATDILVKAGANPYAKTTYDTSPVIVAKMYGNPKILSLLKPDDPNLRQDLRTGSSVFYSLYSEDLLKQARQDTNFVRKQTSLNLKLAHFLGEKRSGPAGASDYRFQLLTHYTLIRYAVFRAEESYREIDSEIINGLKPYNGITWLWIWNFGAKDVILKRYQSLLIKDVVIRGSKKIYHPLQKEFYVPSRLFMEKFDLLGNEFWAFPVAVFDEDNLPLEIIAIDENDNKYILKIEKESLEKIKELK